MEQLLSKIHLPINDKIYVKDPASSDLGNKMIQESVKMIDELGMEQFNFKKLALQLNTTESSIYRYFDSKHKLLLYLVSWYWTWLEYRVAFSTSNVSSPNDKLKRALHILNDPIEGFETVNQMNMPALLRIIIHESSKAFLTKEVDEENKGGFFLAYKSFNKRIAQFITEINPHYSYPHSLTATCIEGMVSQQFYKVHLPSLCDVKNDSSHLEDLFYNLIIQTITTEKK
jgi:AcrR family transcriptional regulator